jgi:ribosome biogenesis protein Nip4
MNDNRPKREIMSLEEATVSNMWEVAAIVEVLERKVLCAKQDLYDIITEFSRKNPRASIPETTFPEPYLLTVTENKIIDDILELLNKHGLTSHQSQHLLERLGRIIEMGQRLPKGTTH